MVPISVGGSRLCTERSGRAYRNRNEDLSASGWTGALSGGSGKRYDADPAVKATVR
mgnify:FL=1